MKPTKPYPTFPLTPHERGWAKKYKGRWLFIRFMDPDAALKEFHRQAKAIDDGISPREAKPPAGQQVTVGEVCTKYAHEREQDHKGKSLSPGALGDYKEACTAMIEQFGRDAYISDLESRHFTALYRWAAQHKGAHALGRFVQSCRTVFRQAYQNGWITAIPNFGTVFRKPPTEHKEGEPFSFEEVAAILGKAEGQVRAMILLMLNAGFTAKDCATLPRAAVDLKLGLVRYRRPKMKRRRPIDRAATLWSETQEALRDVIKERPEDEYIFRTVWGNLWVRDGISATGKDAHIDAFGQEFEKVCVAAGVKPRGPSWLRHFFATVADELEKPHAKARIMGHRLPGMAEVYVDSIEHKRLQVVTDYVRRRLQEHQEPPPEVFPCAVWI